jgi:hypothetical protein
MAAAYDGRDHAGAVNAPEGESRTRIVAIINHLDGVITLRDSEAPENGVTISPGETAGCHLRLDGLDYLDSTDHLGSTDRAEQLRDRRIRDRHIEVQIDCRRGTSARFWLWQADGEILYSRRSPGDPRAAIVPGNSASGGDRVLTIEDGTRTSGGLVGTLWRRLRLPIIRRPARPRLRRSAGGVS